MELGAKGSLPLNTIRMEHVEPTASYVTEIPIPKQNEQKPKPTKAHVPHHHMAYSSNTIANPGMLKAWEGTETMGRRKTYDPRKPCMVGQMNELHTARSHHYLPTQPYFITNSKTEVTVWRHDLSLKGSSVSVSRRNGSIAWLYPSLCPLWNGGVTADVSRSHHDRPHNQAVGKQWQQLNHEHSIVVVKCSL